MPLKGSLASDGYDQVIVLYYIKQLWPVSQPLKGAGLCLILNWLWLQNSTLYQKQTELHKYSESKYRAVKSFFQRGNVPETARTIGEVLNGTSLFNIYKQEEQGGRKMVRNSLI